MLVTALLALAPLPATAPTTSSALCAILQQATAREILAEIEAKGDNAPAKLFDQLGQLQSKEGFRALVEAISSQKKVDKYCRAMQAMRFFNGVEKLEDDALDFLLEHVESSHAKRALNAAMAMGGIWPAGRDDLVNIALKHDSLECRTIALMHLVRRDMDVDVKALKKLASSKNEMVRYEGMLANLNRGYQDVLKVARSKKPADRLAATEHLRLTDHSQKFALLESALSDRDPRVNRKCLNVLEQIGNAEAVGILVRRMEMADVGEQWRTAEALRRMTGMSFGTTAKPWKRWWAREKDSFKPRSADAANPKPTNTTTKPAPAFTAYRSTPSIWFLPSTAVTR